MKRVNNIFFEIHLIDELRSALNTNGVDLDEAIIKLALDYILSSIKVSGGYYDTLPDNVKKVIPIEVYNMCFMSDQDLFEYENCVVGKYTNESMDNCDKRIIIQWPESQVLRELDPELAYCKLINDDLGLELYGSSAYLVNYEWYLENKHKL